MTKKATWTIWHRRGIFFMVLLMGLLALYRTYLSSLIEVRPLEVTWHKSEPADLALLKKDVPLDLDTLFVNTVTADGLMDKGMERKVAERWVKFRHAQRVFKSRDQVQKVYGLDSLWLRQFVLRFESSSQDKVQVSKSNRCIAPSQKRSPIEEVLEEVPTTMAFPEEALSSTSDNVKVLKDEESNRPDRVPLKISIDINQANAYRWQQLRGIGPYYSRKIMNFRTKLGGFSSIEQVGDTYGLPDSVFLAIRSQLVFSPITQKIAINMSSSEDLAKHPYIRLKDARILVHYRKNHGAYTGINDLYSIQAFDSSFVKRLSPYLFFGAEAMQIGLTNE
ncbi:MAG: helix-hairpin-helix domain-containing protein [Saprospiraceae bacterium]|nr:helix-hairpin-helix domain-containing protein [Saprospiraceae bacterium]